MMQNIHSTIPNVGFFNREDACWSLEVCKRLGHPSDVAFCTMGALEIQTAAAEISIELIKLVILQMARGSDKKEFLKSTSN